MPLEKHDFNFNVLNKNRKLTANAQKYLIENIRAQVYDPACRERLTMRELLGYFGHGLRQLAGQMQLPETGLIKTPSGHIKVENEPSNVTVALECEKNGDFKHSQEILTTIPGTKVSAMMESKVGGFSWAFTPAAARIGITGVGRFHGMDYVKDPGFSDNRGYVFESAEDVNLEMVLESVSARLNVSEEEAGKIIQAWSDTAHLNAMELQHRIDEAAVFEAAQMETIEVHEATISTITEELEELKRKHEARKKLIFESAERSVIAIPAENIEAMIRMETKEDVEKALGFFESAATVNLANFPLLGNSFPDVDIPAHNRANHDKPAEYGDTGIVFDEPLTFK